MEVKPAEVMFHREQLREIVAASAERDHKLPATAVTADALVDGEPIKLELTGVYPYHHAGKWILVVLKYGAEHFGIRLTPDGDWVAAQARVTFA